MCNIFCEDYFAIAVMQLHLGHCQQANSFQMPIFCCGKVLFGLQIVIMNQVNKYPWSFCPTILVHVSADFKSWSQFVYQSYPVYTII